jgi:hypothetical protein
LSYIYTIEDVDSDERMTEELTVADLIGTFIILDDLRRCTSF